MTDIKSVVVYIDKKNDLKRRMPSTASLYKHDLGVDNMSCNLAKGGLSAGLP